MSARTQSPSRHTHWRTSQSTMVIFSNLRPATRHRSAIPSRNERIALNRRQYSQGAGPCPATTVVIPVSHNTIMVSGSRFQWAHTLQCMIPADPRSSIPIALAVADRKIIALAQCFPSLIRYEARQRSEENAGDVNKLFESSIWPS